MGRRGGGLRRGGERRRISLLRVGWGGGDEGDELE
jgi:hypothetical protein